MERLFGLAHLAMVQGAGRKITRSSQGAWDPVPGRSGGNQGGDGYAALAVTCFGKPKRRATQYTNSSARVSIRETCGARAQREREFSSAAVGTMRFAFSFPTYCIVRRETSTFARVADWPQGIAGCDTCVARVDRRGATPDFANRREPDERCLNPNEQNQSVD